MAMRRDYQPGVMRQVAESERLLALDLLLKLFRRRGRKASCRLLRIM